MAMRPRDYFPLGKAYGEAFCNREDETKKLIGNLDSGKHTFLVAPRRYGKASLCERAFLNSGLPWSKVDLHIAITEKDLERLILNGVMDLIGKSISQVDKLSVTISQFVKKLKPKFSLGLDYARLELEVSSEASPGENIAEALLLLDRLLVEKNKQAALLLDEFQEIGQISQGRGIEGAIRHAAQETKNLGIVFSGSIPHLIQNMFEDEGRPLYKLCRKIVLPRISKEHYLKHFNKASNLKWSCDLPLNVFDLIMTLTERHPHYVNHLCDEIWSEEENLPDESAVLKAWQQVREEEHSGLVQEYFRLSDNQKRVLKYLALNSEHSPYSADAVKQMDIPPGSIRMGLHQLLEKDFIQKEEEQYLVVNPLYRDFLKE